jgi:protoporphyrinogen oxidase
MKSIGIVGAGISGLSMAFHLLKQPCLPFNKTIIDIYETHSFVGGRIHTQIIEDRKTGVKYHFDVGANLIDF